MLCLLFLEGTESILNSNFRQPNYRFEALKGW